MVVYNYFVSVLKVGVAHKLLSVFANYDFQLVDDDY